MSGQLHALAALTPRKSPRYTLDRGSMDPRAVLDDMEKRKFVTLPGLESRPLGQPTRSQSVYRLRYRDSNINLCTSIHKFTHTTQFDSEDGGYISLRKFGSRAEWTCRATHSGGPKISETSSFTLLEKNILLDILSDKVNDFFFNLPNPSSRTRPWSLLSL
jgi:hypothetical protein